MNNGTRDPRTIRSGDLAERFDLNPRLVEKFAYQDEKDFTLDVPSKKIFHQKNKQSIKAMVSACLTSNEATKPFFVNGCGVKMNAKTHK